MNANLILKVFDTGEDENGEEGHTSIREIEIDGALVEEFFIDGDPKEEEKEKKARKRTVGESNSDVRGFELFMIYIRINTQRKFP